MCSASSNEARKTSLAKYSIEFNDFAVQTRQNFQISFRVIHTLVFLNDDKSLVMSVWYRLTLQFHGLSAKQHAPPDRHPFYLAAPFRCFLGIEWKETGNYFRLFCQIMDMSIRISSSSQSSAYSHKETRWCIYKGNYYLLSKTYSCIIKLVVFIETLLTICILF